MRSIQIINNNINNNNLNLSNSNSKIKEIKTEENTP